MQRGISVGSADITSYMRSSIVSLGLYAIVEPFVRAAFGA